MSQDVSSKDGDLSGRYLHTAETRLSTEMETSQRSNEDDEMAVSIKEGEHCITDIN